MKKGFDRLRGVAAASAMGVAGLVGGGSARATSVSIPRDHVVGSAEWFSIGNLCTPSNFECLLSGQSITTVGGFSKTASQIGYGIADAIITRPTTPTGELTTTWDDFYDGGLSLAVGNVIFENPDNTVDLVGNTLTSDVVVDIIDGIDAQVEYFFHPTRNLVRGLYTLTNTTAATINTRALVMGNYGSDENTTVQVTSSNDTLVEDTDLWVVTNDSGVVGDDSVPNPDPETDFDPTATIATHGTGAGVIPRTVMTLGTPAGGASAKPDNYGYRYNLCIPAGSTVRIMVFNEMSTSIAAAVARAADFESLEAADAAELLTGLDALTQDEIANYVAGVGVCPGGGGGDSSWFALGVPGLLGVLGSLLLFRQRGGKDRQ